MPKTKPVPIGELLAKLYEDQPAHKVQADMLQAKISTAIAAERIARDMNQTQFAKFMGVTQSQVSKWENGGFHFSVEKLCEIAEKLDLEVTVSLKKKPALQSRTFGNITYVAFSSGNSAWRSSASKDSYTFDERKKM